MTCQYNSVTTWSKEDRDLYDEMTSLIQDKEKAKRILKEAVRSGGDPYDIALEIQRKEFRINEIRTHFHPRVVVDNTT